EVGERPVDEPGELGAVAPARAAVRPVRAGERQREPGLAQRADGGGGGPAHGQIATAPRSPVRTRTTSSTGTTQTLPSPMRPVCAAWTIAPLTRVTSSSSTRTSRRIFGTRSTAYSAPR